MVSSCLGAGIRFISQSSQHDALARSRLQPRVAPPDKPKTLSQVPELKLAREEQLFPARGFKPLAGTTSATYLVCKASIRK